jgi:hypothetical protein
LGARIDLIGRELKKARIEIKVILIFISKRTVQSIRTLKTGSTILCHSTEPPPRAFSLAPSIFRADPLNS